MGRGVLISGGMYISVLISGGMYISVLISGGMYISVLISARRDLDGEVLFLGTY